ncbi:unnamed protein product, partial [Brenthis ino]
MKRWSTELLHTLLYGAREISSLNYVEYAVQSVISICMGWRGRRSSRSRARSGVEGDSRGREARGGMLRGRSRRSISRVTGVTPRQTECLPYYIPLPTTRLFNTCRIWDASFFMLNDRAA